MPSQTAERSPRTEISQSLPAAPPAEAEPRDPASAGAESLRLLTMERFARLRRQAPDDPAAAAALAMIGGGDAASADALLDGLELPAGQRASGPALQALALRLDEAGRGGDAALVLALLAGGEADRRSGMLGLGVLAARHGRMEEAFALAAAAGGEGAHPRALSLLGVCELERGNGTEAQAHLAAAARLARRDPHFRTEMQIAQRALLLMHLHA